MHKNISGRFVFFAALLLSIANAAGVGQLSGAVSSLCGSMTSLLPVVGMLMILVGAVVYAAGQVMGAETRARANVWATSCLTGALVAMLIVAIAPSVFKTMDPTMRADCSYVCFGSHVSRVLAAGTVCCVVYDGDAAYGCPADRPFCSVISGDGGCYTDAALTDGVTCDSLGTCGTDCTFDTSPPVCPG